MSFYPQPDPERHHAPAAEAAAAPPQAPATAALAAPASPQGQPQQPAEVTVKVSNTAERTTVTPSGPVKQNLGFHRVTADDIRGASDGSIMATVQRIGSGLRPSQPRGNDLVTLPGGVVTTVDVATGMGLLRRTESGGWADVSAPQGQPQGPQQGNHEVNPAGNPEGATEDEGVVGFPGAVEQELGTFMSAVPSQQHGTLIESVISAGGEVKIDPSIAQSAGMDHQVLSAGIEHARNAFAAQATAELAKIGVSGPEFAAWAQQNAPQEFAAAMREHVYGRKPTAYNTLAQRYLAKVAPTTDTLKQAGVQVNPARRGQVETIVIHGIETTRAAAAKAGLI